MAETKTTTKKLTIDQKIFEIQKSAIVEKKRKAKNYNFYNIEDMYEVLLPLIDEQNILVSYRDETIFDGTGRAFVKTCLTLKDMESNESLVYDTVSEVPQNAGVMSSQQATETAVKFARKQCLENAFRITSPEVDLPSANHIPSNNRASEDYF